MHESDYSALAIAERVRRRKVRVSERRRRSKERNVWVLI